MNYTEMLFNRDERLVNLLNQADSKNLELIEEINKKEDEIDRLNNIINELEKWLNEDEYFNGRKLKKDYTTVLVTDVLDKLKELKNGDNNE